jgi:enamine deaminase RidA (YjgF/YER057c/UK114 family)
MRKLALALFAFCVVAGSATAAPPPPAVVHTGSPMSPISTTVTVPAGSTLVYVSGLTPDVTAPDLPKDQAASYGDTAAQTLSVMKKIHAALQAQGLDMKDVSMMHVYLVGDPAKGGKMDFAGMMSSYLKFFGTAEQASKPSRTTVQVAALVSPAIMVEIDCVAAKAP